MRIISLNINGIRAFYNRLDETALHVLMELNPDIVAFQETKANDEVVSYYLSEYTEIGYKVYSCSNNLKKGYAGVAFLVKENIKPESVYIQHWSTDDNSYMDGRIIALEFKNFLLVNVYTLNSGSGKEDYRLEWDEYYINWIKSINKHDKPLILCGDFNVCYDDIDNYNPDRFYDVYPGMYEFERTGMSNIRKELNVIDSWRTRNPETIKYTWFSNMYGAYDKGYGWRLDYFLLSPEIDSKVTNCEIYDGLRISDHHPISIDLSC